MIKVVDAIGMECPVPVARTREAIRQLNGPGIVETLVDNETAVQNLQKMAAQMHYGVRTEKLDSDSWRVVISVKEPPAVHEEKKTQEKPEEEEMEEIREDLDDLDALAHGREGKRETVVQFASDAIGGTADGELGRILLEQFIAGLAEREEAPDALLFYKRGIFLTCTGSRVLKNLQTLQEKGARLLVNDTSLEYYRMREQLQIGEEAGMQEMEEILLKADITIRP